MHCPSCQSANRDDARFCQACGSSLGDSPAAREHYLRDARAGVEDSGAARRVDQVSTQQEQGALDNIPSTAEEVRSAFLLILPLLFLIGVFLVRAAIPGSDAGTSHTPPTPTEVADRTYRVVNTGPGTCANGSAGVALRTSPVGQSSPGYCDGTVLVMIGTDVESNGLVWREVRGPDGREGFVPAQYTEPVE